MVKQSPDPKPAGTTESTGSASSSPSSCKYKGVRKRKWGKWVSEIRLPNSRERIWLGSYDSAEKAARAFDAALFCLRGRSARFNFPDNPPDIAGARSLSHAEIQAAAARFANSTMHSSSSSNALTQTHSEDSDRSTSPSPSVSDGTMQMDSDLSLDALNGSCWDLQTNNNNSNNNTTNSMELDNYYPSEYGIFQGFDDLSNDFYVPTMDPSDHGEENYDGVVAQEPFLWNF
ncbi:ethylene-responsive transcription factor ERF017-like [Punica granatum]|uniref:Ethylene-responsive transcription factor ERF017-like n=1 Tax=Punica granatum TaxID=22663 RepID=A0A6P8CB44_PUNGR|nr:ethylene-responsive transcription factor ERF017-like [Punica granatum]